jgi:hypothetical protein
LGNLLKLEPKQRGPATHCRRVQSSRHPALKDSPLTPELKEFIDRAIVPILVKEYLAVTNLENGLAEKDADAAHFVSSTAARKLRAVRP